MTLSSQNEPQFELVDETEPAPRAPEDDEDEQDDRPVRTRQGEQS